MFKIDNLAVKSNLFYETKNPLEQSKDSSWTLIKIVQKALLKEGPKTAKIELKNALIDCEVLSQEDSEKPLSDLQLTWFQKRYFVPINVMLPDSKVMRVLMNKSSFLKNCATTDMQKKLGEKIFSQEWDISALQLLQQIFRNSFQLVSTEIYENLTLEKPEQDPNINIDTARDLLKIIGASKNPNSINTSDTDLIARTVMRHPKKEAKDLLIKLHTAIKEKFGNLKDEELSFLLTKSASSARGGFHSVQSLRKFFNQNASTIPNSRLITGIETLLTSIAYMITEQQQTNATPLTEDQKPVYDLCAEFQTFAVPDPVTSYPDRISCYVRAAKIHDTYNSQTEISIHPRNEISEGSDTDTPSNSPKNYKLIIRKYKREGNTRTWVYTARKSNIPLCSSLSGTVTIIFPIADWLLSNETNKQGTLLSQEAAELLAGALAIPTYIRGDYHSVVETSTGFYHYLAKRNKEDSPTEVISPKEAFQNGLRLMSNAVDEKFKKSIEVLSDEMMKNITDETYTPETLHRRKKPPVSLFEQTNSQSNFLKP